MISWLELVLNEYILTRCYSAPFFFSYATHSSAPTLAPTLSPTLEPTLAPTLSPTELPTLLPTELPTGIPTLTPTELPTVSIIRWLLCNIHYFSSLLYLTPSSSHLILTCPFQISPSLSPTLARKYFILCLCVPELGIIYWIKYLTHSYLILFSPIFFYHNSYVSTILISNCISYRITKFHTYSLANRQSKCSNRTGSSHVLPYILSNRISNGIWSL